MSKKKQFKIMIVLDEENSEVSVEVDKDMKVVDSLFCLSNCVINILKNTIQDYATSLDLMTSLHMDEVVHLRQAFSKDEKELN